MIEHTYKYIYIYMYINMSVYLCNIYKRKFFFFFCQHLEKKLPKTYTQGQWHVGASCRLALRVQGDHFNSNAGRSWITISFTPSQCHLCHCNIVFSDDVFTITIYGPNMIFRFDFGMIGSILYIQMQL